MDAQSFGLVLVTVPSQEEADRISSALLGEGLAACVTRLNGAVSTFMWEGRIERAEEILLLIKTRTSLFRTLQERIGALHSYEVPEIILLPFAAGTDAYLRWMDAVLTRTVS